MCGNKSLIKYWWHAGLQSNEPQSIKTYNGSPPKNMVLWEAERQKNRWITPMVKATTAAAIAAAMASSILSNKNWVYTFFCARYLVNKVDFIDIFTHKHIVSRPHRLDNNVWLILIQFGVPALTLNITRLCFNFIPCVCVYVFFSLPIICTYHFVQFFFARPEQQHWLL